MNYRNSVRTRVMLAFATVIVVFGGAVALSIARLAAFNTGMEQVAGPQLQQVENVDRWSIGMLQSMRHTRNVLLMDDKAEIQKEIDAARASNEQRKKYADDLVASIRSAEGKDLLQAALDARGMLVPLDDEFLRQAEAGDLKAAKETRYQRLRPAQSALFAALEKLGEHQKSSIQTTADALEASYRSARTYLIALAVAAVAVACVLSWLVTLAITNPLNHAITVLAEIEKGNYASKVAVGSKDELGQTLQGLERMQSALRDRTQKEHAAALENARMRTALDRMSVGAMLADPAGIIVYANDAVLAIFRARVGEIRKQLPNFDADRIVGASFDTFHRNASHQRNLLAGLMGTHTIDIKMGDAVLRAVVNSVNDAAGKRVGSVVQWVDRTAEVAAQLEVETVVARAIEGDLMVRIREEGKEVFFKTLASGVNRLLANMADVVRSMSLAAAEVRAGSEEISRGNVDLSQRTEEQASSLEQTASSMEEMTSTVRNNADNAAQANQLASAAREQAERGGAVVGAAVVAMEEINTSSRRIADIISVIDEIAFQTNLLALNAAVEAARAGEQGRGFAVVASEVRNLASRSAEAAKEIKTLIQDSVGKVTEGTKLVDESGKVLAEIVTRVKKVTDVMAEIANSSREQASGIDQVNKAITMMDEVTQQNAALVEEASAAAQALSEQAGKLSQMIARYRVGEGGANEAPRVPAPKRIPSPPVVHAPPTPSAAVRVERRSPTRPMTGNKRTPSAAPTAAARPALPADEEQWKEF
jgi:methyl-accepting chemotaxis protein